MSETNPNARLEMFCDGVFAIAITLLIIEIKIPPLDMMHSVADVWEAILHLWPSFLALILSFIIIFISWRGHHMLLNALDKTSNQFQFANGFFLLTVVIIPFPTAFMAEYFTTPYAQAAIVFYCLCSLLHNLGWRFLLRSAIKPICLTTLPGSVNVIYSAMKGNQLGTILHVSIALLSWWFPYVALALSILMWSYWLYTTVNVKQLTELEYED